MRDRVYEARPRSFLPSRFPSPPSLIFRPHQPRISDEEVANAANLLHSLLLPVGIPILLLLERPLILRPWDGICHRDCTICRCDAAIICMNRLFQCLHAERAFPNIVTPRYSSLAGLLSGRSGAGSYARQRTKFQRYHTLLLERLQDMIFSVS